MWNFDVSKILKLLEITKQSRLFFDVVSKKNFIIMCDISI